MENAGRGTAELLRSLGIKGKVCICCGKGNNGGDGLVVARYLDIAEVPISIILFGQPERLIGDAALNYRIVSKARLPLVCHDDETFDEQPLQRELQNADWVVDALFGTGLAGPVRPPFDDVIRVINASVARVMAVDTPSGLDCDTGEPLGATIRASHTATFVAVKQGFVNPRAKDWLGDVHVVDIGMPRRLLQAGR